MSEKSGGGRKGTRSDKATKNDDSGVGGIRNENAERLVKPAASNQKKTREGRSYPSPGMQAIQSRAEIMVRILAAVLNGRQMDAQSVCKDEKRNSSETIP